MSNVVNKSDFYYGVFLAKVLKKENKLALISKSGQRGIYDLNTDKGNYLVYIKYASLKNKNNKKWTFNYTDKNLKEIESYIKEGRNIIFSFICAYDDLNNCEIAIANLEEFNKCINTKCKINKNNKNIKIYKKPHSPLLRMYGTARSDIKNGKENTLNLKRDRINKL